MGVTHNNKPVQQFVVELITVHVQLIQHVVRVIATCDVRGVQQDARLDMDLADQIVKPA
jgi:hypothetical protein